MNGSGWVSIEIQPICGVALACCAHVNRGSKQLPVAPPRNTRRVELMAEASGAEYSAPPVSTAWGQRASYRDRREARRAASEHMSLSRLPDLKEADPRMQLHSRAIRQPAAYRSHDLGPWRQASFSIRLPCWRGQSYPGDRRRGPAAYPVGY